MLQTNPMNTSPYNGKSALMLLRVSSPQQEERYGWPSQERSIREKLIQPLGLALNEEKHIIRDTYTGLEFRERPVLNRILDMAQRHEFDVLVMDVLDRLGRKGLARELYRMQLREFGVRILTTDPNDHADDDSLVGEMVRVIKGYQAEEELNNTRRRTMNGRREKALGNAEKGIPPKIIGNGHRYYGYNYILDNKGTRVGLTLKLDVILVDEDGTEWTEVSVVVFIIESAARGVPLRQIARLLNGKGIPPPSVAKGITPVNKKYPPIWQPYAVGRIVWQSVYYGEARFFKKRSLARVGGKKDVRERTTEAEQAVVPVPAIVTKELAVAAQEKVTRNRFMSSRNNKHPQDYLLRAGLAKCGYCGGTMTVQSHTYTSKGGVQRKYSLYACTNQATLLDFCKGCSILTSTLDAAAWEKALAIIQDPLQVDKRVQAYKSDDPTADRRKNINAKLKELRQEQAALQDYLTERIKKRKLDKKTEDHLTSQLHQLAENERKWEEELGKDEDMHQQWKKIQEGLETLHRRCEVMREKLRDPHYTPGYDEKRELCEFFGITGIVWKKGTKPPYETKAKPPSIVSLLSVLELL
jgi:DNA invertase Pin-like site-specific DNA recombinase